MWEIIRNETDISYYFILFLDISFKVLTVYKTIVTTETEHHFSQAPVIGMAGLLEIQGHPTTTFGKYLFGKRFEI